MEVGENIRRIRLSRRPKLTQDALASAAGISDVALHYIETGRNNPSVATLEKIANALGIAVAELFRDPPRKKR